MSLLTAEDLPEHVDISALEEEVLALWDRIGAFELTLRRSAGRPIYSFYDGPPFATGLPHYGHILAGTVKDIVTRYATMTGFHVPRRFGWDCHGLPIEFEINQSLGLRTREQVMAYGVARYNEACRSIVLRYTQQWEASVRRLGRWIDFAHAYRTMDPDYMESVWAVIAQLHDKGLLYEGTRVMPYSTGCTTPLSNFEAGLSYKTMEDPSLWVLFPVVVGDGPRHRHHPNRDDDMPATPLNFLAWTTTPWTLPSNLALCVHPTATYVEVACPGHGRLIVAEECLRAALGKIPLATDHVGISADDEAAIVLHRMPGHDLVGLRYEPPFSALQPLYPAAFRVVADAYVSMASGSGVVHQAAAHGQDDARVCLAAGICAGGLIGDADAPIACLLDDAGVFVDPAPPPLVGLSIKEAEKPIIAHLRAAGRLFRRETIAHSYPFCWRSDTPLIYRPVRSWFVRVTALGDRLFRAVEPTRWAPEAVKDRRFKSWLADARDWLISRNRFWGTPLPIWVNPDDRTDVVVVRSRAHFTALTGVTVADLHCHTIDVVPMPSAKHPGQHLRRVPFVLDCWFESGAMPYAALHVPFENAALFQAAFPADFVAEGVDQTRGWFYTLLVLGVALHDVCPFKNLVATGLVLAADGKKMSKRLKNYPDATDVVRRYGADALRLYLVNSPLTRAEPLRFREDAVHEVMREVMLRWYNTLRFFAQVAQRSETRRNGALPRVVARVLANDPQLRTAYTDLDIWILSVLQRVTAETRADMAAYRLYATLPRAMDTLEQLSNVYVRFNRMRLKGVKGGASTMEMMDATYVEDVTDTTLAQAVLTVVLFKFALLVAPFVPFFSEFCYQRLIPVLPPAITADAPTIHLLPYVEDDPAAIDEATMQRVADALQVIETVRAAREAANLPLRRPLREVTVVHSRQDFLEHVQRLQDVVASEAGIQAVAYCTSFENTAVRTKLALINQRVGGRLRGDRQAVQAVLDELPAAAIDTFLATHAIDILGHRISDEDVTVTRVFGGGEDRGIIVRPSARDPQLTLIIDANEDDHVVEARIARELTNRIQRLRKAAKLFHHIAAIVYLRGAPHLFEPRSRSAVQAIERSTHTSILPGAAITRRDVALGTISTDLVEHLTVQITLVRADAVADVEVIVQDGIADRDEAVLIADMVATAGYRTIGAREADEGGDPVYRFTLKGREIVLRERRHLFESQHGLWVAQGKVVGG